MAGVYRPRHPERTVLYRVLFHYFDRFLAEREELISEALVDRIINHLKLTFAAERPPPPHLAWQEFLMVAETGAEYFS